LNKKLINNRSKTTSVLVLFIFLFVLGVLGISGCQPGQEAESQISASPLTETADPYNSPEDTQTSEIIISPTPTMESGTFQATPTFLQSQPINNKISGIITLWHPFQEGTPERQSLDSLVANSKFIYPNLELQTVLVPESEIWRDYQIDVIAGGGPDLFIANNAGLLSSAQSGLIQNLDASFAGKSDQFFPRAIEGVKVNQSVYGIPISIQTIVMYFNKSQIPIPPLTSAELLDMLRNGKRMANIQSAYHLYGWAGAFGGILTDDNGRCIADQTGWLESLNYLLELKNVGAVFNSDYRAVEEIFLRGDTDILLQGTWEMGRYVSVLGDHLGVAALPAGPSGPSSPLITINGIYLNPKSANKEAALEIMGYLSGQVAQQTFANSGYFLPARPDIQTGNALLEAVASGAGDGTAIPQNEGFSNYWLPFDKMYTNVINGEVSPQQGLSIACMEMNTANNK
jgi:arabinogalactan oligomer/maltooligosaccharide transport system substrate-binding protein